MTMSSERSETCTQTRIMHCARNIHKEETSETKTKMLEDAGMNMPQGRMIWHKHA